jgi:hypothetical protein
MGANGMHAFDVTLPMTPPCLADLIRRATIGPSRPVAPHQLGAVPRMVRDREPAERRAGDFVNAVRDSE